MAEIPCGAAAHGEVALNLARAHALLGFGDEINCAEPFPERQMAVVKDGSRRNGEMLVAPHAIVSEPALDFGDFLTLAARAFNAFQPANILKMLSRLFGIRELLHQLDEIHVSRFLSGVLFHKI